MRDMPRLLHEAGLELADGRGALYANVGSGRFWANAVEAYSVVLSRSELLPPDVVEDWRAFQAQSVRDGTFFRCLQLLHLPGQAAGVARTPGRWLGRRTSPSRRRPWRRLGRARRPIRMTRARPRAGRRRPA
jgi:hypothetical protein